MCEVSGKCKADFGYAVTQGGRLLRFTFSRSLAEFVALRANADVQRARVRLGDELNPGDTS